MRYTSALLSDARGALSGAVASRNRGGSYFRRRVAPVQPRSVKQSAVRAALNDASTLWRTLTEAQRQGWGEAAQTISRTSSLGNQIHLSGAQLFSAINTQRLYLGSAAILDATVPSAIPQAPTDAAIAPVTGPPDFVLGLSWNVPLTAGQTMLVFASAPQSAGRTTVSRSQFRGVTSFGVEVTQPQHLDAAYAALYGAVPASGSKVFLELQVIDDTTGYFSPRTRIDYLIP